MNSAYPKPIIGLVGGIGSGKTLIAGELGHLGCLVVDSDDLAHRALHEPEIKATLLQWWGDGILNKNNVVDRSKVGRVVFGNPDELRRLTALLHPRVAELREKMMAEAALDDRVPAVVWDSPLLVETGLHTQCDAIIFVKASLPIRNQRLQSKRGWDAAELHRRENMQMPLDKKEKLAHYHIDNDGDVAVGLGQVRGILARIVRAKTGNDLH